MAKRNKYPFEIMSVGDYFEVPAHLYGVMRQVCMIRERQHATKYRVQVIDGGIVRVTMTGGEKIGFDFEVHHGS